MVLLPETVGRADRLLVFCIFTAFMIFGHAGLVRFFLPVVSSTNTHVVEIFSFFLCLMDSLL